MRNILYTCCLLLFIHPLINAQADTIIVNFDPVNKLTVDHVIKQGQTIFGLSHEYGSNVNETIELNSEKNLNIISVGSIIKFRFNTAILSDSAANAISTPVYYAVKPKETLYTISRLYIGRDVKDIMILNKKKSYDLDINEKLLIGFIKSLSQEPKLNQISPAKDVLAVIPNDEKERLMSLPKTEVSIDSFQLESFVKKLDVIHKERGMAIWESTEYGAHELLVMHPSARVNSKIRLYNPMMNKVVEAKVVGTMPKNSYPQNISVVISPGVAHALGALDKRFLVEMTYTE